MDTSFDDGKDDGALRTIGEVGDALGIKSHVLRYWEGQFPMLQPLKRSGGRRYYRPEDVALLREIDRLVNGEGYTLRGAKAALKGWKPGRADAPTGTAADGAPSQNGTPTSSTTDIRDRLLRIRGRLEAALDA